MGASHSAYTATTGEDNTPRRAGTDQIDMANRDPCELRKPLQKKVDLLAVFGFAFLIVLRQLMALCAMF
jgi:hypothetical protein